MMNPYIKSSIYGHKTGSDITLTSRVRKDGQDLEVFILNSDLWSQLFDFYVTDVTKIPTRDHRPSSLLFPEGDDLKEVCTYRRSSCGFWTNRDSCQGNLFNKVCVYFILFFHILRAFPRAINLAFSTLDLGGKPAAQSEGSSWHDATYEGPVRLESRQLRGERGQSGN